MDTKTTKAIGGEKTTTGGVAMTAKTIEGGTPMVSKKLVSFKKEDMLDKLRDKCEENDCKLEGMINNPEISEATIRTQKYQLGKENKALKLMAAFIKQVDKENISLSPIQAEWFETVSTLTSVRKAARVHVSAGDSLLELLQKYSTVKDVYGKIMKEAESAGLEMKDGVFVSK